MKYYLIAGEASGDLHGANLMRALQEKDPNAQFRFFGGDLMAKYGGKPAKHYKEMAFMGYLQVISHLPQIIRNLKYCKQDIIKFNPDVVVLIDYAGFNLKIAKFAFNNKLKVFYYISPKIWAWKTYRVKAIKKYVQKMYTILPFETKFFSSHNYHVNYVGNPVNDAINKRPDQDQTFEGFTNKNNLSDKPIIAILAGSRQQEIRLMLPTMIEVSSYFKDYQFIIAGAPGINEKFYKIITANTSIPIVYNQTYQLLQQSKAALVTSGTATLETGLLCVPQIVCYNTTISNFLYKIGRKIIRVKYISLVNLILDREAVREMIQQEFKTNLLVKELDLILNNNDYRNKILNSYAELKNRIGSTEVSEKTASLMIENLKK